MAGAWRRFFRMDGWAGDIIWWIHNPWDLLRSPRRDPSRARRRVHLDEDGNVTRIEEPGDRPSA